MKRFAVPLLVVLVVAVSVGQPKFYDVNGIKLYTSIVHDPLTSPSDYIELDESGVLEDGRARRGLLVNNSTSPRDHLPLPQGADLVLLGRTGKRLDD